MYTKFCTKLWAALESLKHDERGVTALEYVILAAIVIAAIIGASTQFDFNTWFGTIASKVTTAVNS
jgi:pilus assembly protein Flp/PilA